MSPAQRSNARASGTSRIALALGMAVPLSASLYTQHQERETELRREELREQSVAHAAVDKDKGLALALHTQLQQLWLSLPATDGSASDAAAARASVCRVLAHEVRFAEAGNYGDYALVELVAAFQSRIDGTPLDESERGPRVSAVSVDAPRVRVALAVNDTVACACDGAYRRFVSLFDVSPELRRRTTSVARASLQRDLANAGESCVVSRDSVASTDADATSDPVTGNDRSVRSGGAATAATGRVDATANLTAPAAAAATPGDVVVDAAEAARLAAIVERRMRVYIQVPGPADESLRCLQRRLRDHGYLVPEIEDVGPNAPKTDQLRYVDAGEKPFAVDLLGDIRRAQGQCADNGGQLARFQVPTAPADFTRFRGKARPFHFELWVGTTTYANQPAQEVPQR